MAGCAEHPQADTSQDPFSSIEEFAERLAPHSDPDDPAGLAGPPTSQSVVQVRASLWHDNAVVYLRYQTGGSNDLETAIAATRDLVVDTVSAFTGE